MSDLQWLSERFAQARERQFIIQHDRAYTYGWLLEAMDRWRETLDEAGVAPGRVVAIEGDYAPDVVALLLVLIERDAVIVPLTSSVEVHKPEFRAIAEVQTRIVFGEDGAPTITHQDVAVENALTRTLLDRGAPGLVLFSSGSTGKSKAALHDFARLLEKFAPRRHTFVTLTFLLLDHIGGINTLLYVLSNTGTVVSVASRDPDVVCRAIAEHGVELLPTSPTFINLLLISEAYKRHDLSPLKRITYGTEPMPQHTLDRIHEVLPAVILQQTYGLSELGILRSKSRSSDSLWVKIGGEGFETKVVDGTLRIRARSAMLGYLNAPSPFDEEGWFDTGDEVEVDGEYLRFRGRRSEVINVGGEKVYPTEVESVLMAMPNVKDAVVVGAPNPITGQIVVARVSLIDPEEQAGFRKRMRQFCRTRLPRYKIPATVEIVEGAQHSPRFKKMRGNDNDA